MRTSESNCNCDDNDDNDDDDHNNNDNNKDAGRVRRTRKRDENYDRFSSCVVHFVLNIGNEIHKFLCRLFLLLV
jgi:hypothetical protein